MKTKHALAAVAACLDRCIRDYLEPSSAFALMDKIHIYVEKNIVALGAKVRIESNLLCCQQTSCTGFFACMVNSSNVLSRLHV
jgi:hypothetical protein